MFGLVRTSTVSSFPRPLVFSLSPNHFDSLAKSEHQTYDDGTMAGADSLYLWPELPFWTGYQLALAVP